MKKLILLLCAPLLSGCSHVADVSSCVMPETTTRVMELRWRTFPGTLERDYARAMSLTGLKIRIMCDSHSRP